MKKHRDGGAFFKLQGRPLDVRFLLKGCVLGCVLLCAKTRKHAQECTYTKNPKTPQPLHKSAIKGLFALVRMKGLEPLRLLTHDP